MSLGFAQAGLAPSLAADIDPDACSTYERNLGGAIHCVDLSAPSSGFVSRLRAHGGAFALIGGPPCQGFSSAGGKRGSDERNRLIFNYFNIVETLRPRWFLFENVEGLLTSDGGERVVDLVRRFVGVGYRVRLEKVNLAGYGLPQARKRVLLIGNLLGIDFRLPAPTHSFNAGKHKSSERLPAAPSFDDATEGLGPAGSSRTPVRYVGDDALGAYDALMRRGNASGTVTMHGAAVLSGSLAATIGHLAPGDTMRDLPEGLWHESYHRRANRRVADGTPSERRGGAPSGVKRLRGDLNSLTITSATTREFIHPHEDRPLTIREAARLQSFPDCYQFDGNAISASRQIGNAFPPLAAEVLARHLATLDEEARATPEEGAAGALIGFQLTGAAGMSPALARTASKLTEMLGNSRQAGLERADERSRGA